MGLEAKNPFENNDLLDDEIDAAGVVLDEDEGGLEGSILTEIDHIAIAVTDLDAAIDDYRETFGATVDHRETVESDGVEEALLKVAESYIQLLAPTNDDSPVAKYLAKKGPGLHHIGYRVDDCAAALAAVKAQGHRVIDEAPRPGSRGTTVAFVHPKSLHGVLIELVQE
jgi:methylmalonyl-CoA/ethylmalonyl-CoA epimerase